MKEAERTFNLSRVAGGPGSRKPIKERGIKWEEAYHKRSAPLKKRFDRDIGPGAYMRWEGHDYTTDSDYYVVVGPSVHKDRGKMFFSGIKKLPPERERTEGKTYSPYGEYFSNIKAAFSYATDRWGVPFPRNQAQYTVDNLMPVDIPRHIKG